MVGCWKSQFVVIFRVVLVSKALGKLVGRGSAVEERLVNLREAEGAIYGLDILVSFFS